MRIFQASCFSQTSPLGMPSRMRLTKRYRCRRFSPARGLRPCTCRMSLRISTFCCRRFNPVRGWETLLRVREDVELLGHIADALAAKGIIEAFMREIILSRIGGRGASPPGKPAPRGKEAMGRAGSGDPLEGQNPESGKTLLLLAGLGALPTEPRLRVAAGVLFGGLLRGLPAGVLGWEEKAGGLS